MPHIDQSKLITIITCSPAKGNLERTPWQPNCHVNLDGMAVGQHYFETVSENLYIDILIHDTITVVDYYIEQMILNSKDEWGGRV